MCFSSSSYELDTLPGFSVENKRQCIHSIKPRSIPRPTAERGFETDEDEWTQKIEIRNDFFFVFCGGRSMYN